jgi:transposase InsO family protein
MISLIARTFQLCVYNLLICFVDRITRLPRNSSPPEVMRILRENMALKAQVRALVLELKVQKGKRPKVSLATRAAQVFAFLLTRGDKAFQNYYLSASKTTISRWATILRRGPWPWRKKRGGGRPSLSQEIKDLIIKFKKSNPLWGAKRIRDELRRMGIMVSEPTVQRVLKENGFHPRDGHPRSWEQYKSAAKDAIWALDFFFVRTARGTWFQVLLVIDIYTRELIELRAFNGWEADSEWTINAFADSISREERKPEMVIHDHGTQFLGQFERQLRVLDIERKRTPTALPFTNGVAERAVKSVRLEILNHVRVNDADELQWYLDEYKTFYNVYRPNQAIGGRTPAEYGRGEEAAEVIDLAEAKQRRLVRHSFAHGLLNAYELVA